ncbi:MAG: HEPN domain-containing protein [bacterium]
MSLEKAGRIAQRWVLQAKDDLAAATVLAAHKKYAQACFHCQQSGEKMMKAVWFSLGEDPWGHSIFNLIIDLKNDNIRESLEAVRLQALLLDKLYIPTRYPNGLPDLVPMDAYGQNDFDTALKALEDIIRLCESIIPQSNENPK